MAGRHEEGEQTDRDSTQPIGSTQEPPTSGFLDLTRRIGDQAMSDALRQAGPLATPPPTPRWDPDDPEIYIGRFDRVTIRSIMARFGWSDLKAVEMCEREPLLI